MFSTCPSVLGVAPPTGCTLGVASGDNISSSAPGVVALTGCTIGRLGSRRPNVAGVSYRPM